MFTTKDGENIFVIDSHIALWDGSKANQRNKHGEEFINCFYNYHKIGPKEYHWPREKFERYTGENLIEDVFTNGYADMAIFQPAYLGEFYKEGFGNMRRQAELTEQHPDRLINNGMWDPRNGEAGLERLEMEAEVYKLKGVKLYTADWNGDSKGYKLTDPWAQKYLAKSEELGIKNIHVHKGPTILPLNRDAFDVADVDDAASSFPNLNFVVEHCGLPRLEDFCWIATQEPNVYAGLAVASALIHTRKKFFAEIISELLYWVGSDRILMGSDYAIWQPKWIIEQFMALELTEEQAEEANHTLTLEIRRKILGENCARLYDIDIPTQCAKLGLPMIAEPVGHDTGVAVA